MTVVFILAPGALPPVESLETLAQTRATVEVSEPAEIATAIAEATSPEEKQILWDRLVEAWVTECTPDGAVADVTAEVATADEFGADRFWRSERLDLDHLSGLEGPGTLE